MPRPATARTAQRDVPPKKSRRIPRHPVKAIKKKHFIRRAPRKRKFNELSRGKVRHADQRLLTSEELKRAVFEYRVEGYAEQDIADAFSISQQRVSEILKEVLQKKHEQLEELSDRYLEMELERIDRMLVAWSIKAKSDTRAADVLYKWLAQRHKLLGLEVSRTELSGKGGGAIHVTASDLDLSKLNEKQLKWLEIILALAGPKVDLPEDGLPALEAA